MGVFNNFDRARVSLLLLAAVVVLLAAGYFLTEDGFVEGGSTGGDSAIPEAYLIYHSVAAGQPSSEFTMLKAVGPAFFSVQPSDHNVCEGFVAGLPCREGNNVLEGDEQVNYCLLKSAYCNQQIPVEEFGRFLRGFSYTLSKERAGSTWSNHTKCRIGAVLSYLAAGFPAPEEVNEYCGSVVEYLLSIPMEKYDLSFTAYATATLIYCGEYNALGVLCNSVCSWVAEEYNREIYWLHGGVRCALAYRAYFSASVCGCRDIIEPSVMGLRSYCTEYAPQEYLGDILAAAETFKDVGVSRR